MAFNCIGCLNFMLTSSNVLEAFSVVGHGNSEALAVCGLDSLHAHMLFTGKVQVLHVQELMQMPAGSHHGSAVAAGVALPTQKHHFLGDNKQCSASKLCQSRGPEAFVIMYLNSTLNVAAENHANMTMVHEMLMQDSL